MKVTAPDDLGGRMIACEQRAQLIATTLQSMASAYTDMGAPDEATLNALGAVAEELADEIDAVRDGYVSESNARID